MTTKFQNKPKCKGGCLAPYESFVSKNSGKAFNKCTVCENLVFPDSKRVDTTPAETRACDHQNCARLDKVVMKDGENKGRPYTVCSGCRQDFKWADVPQQANQAPQANTATTYSLPLTTLVQDFGGKLDTAVKSILELQSALHQQQQTQDEFNRDLLQRVAALESAATSAAATSAAVSLKRARTQQ